MTPVYQKFVAGTPKPDCMSACVASIFDLSRDEVPNFYPDIPSDGQTFLNNINKFTMEKLNKVVVYAPVTMAPKDKYYIVSFAYKGAINNHAMVAYNDTIVHCPAYPYFHQEGPIKMEDYVKDNPTAFKNNVFLFLDKDKLEACC